VSSVRPGPCDEGVIRLAPAAPCDPRAGRWILAATILGSSMAFIDGTVVSVALPVLQARLDASVSGAQWIVEAYLLLLSSLVLVGGSLADRFGRRRIFSIGTVVFAAASLACGLANGVSTIVAARAAQGVGAALLVPSSLAILGAAFPPGERGRAVGTWSALTAVATAIAPALGGWLVQVVSWRAIFLINLPIAAVALLIARSKVPESRNPAEAALDLPGAVLATAGLGALIYGLIEAPAAGWSHPRAWGPITAGAAALAAFLAVERRSHQPMVPPALFRVRTFAAANLLTLFLYGALSAMFFFLPFELIQARGYSAAAAGAAILPLVILVSLLSRTAGKIADRAGARLPLTAGPVVAACGFFLLGALPVEAGYAASLLPSLSVLGLGMAITVAPLTTTVLNAVDREDAGTASGINNAVARVAGLLAIAAFGVVAAAVFNRSLDRRLEAAGVSAATRQLLDPERGRLGAMKPPAGAAAKEARSIEQAVKASLDSSFRAVGWICGALALLASASAAWGVRETSSGRPLPRRAQPSGGRPMKREATPRPSARREAALRQARSRSSPSGLDGPRSRNSGRLSRSA
jgi:EmrB/QacA subfamily drug resistance transporter